VTSSRTTTLLQSSVAPPPYAAAPSSQAPVDDEKAALAQAEAEKPADDTLHFLNHDHDSIASLSLRYGVPAAALRRANNINSDHLLLGRKTILIPGEFYKEGVSLSPQPIDGEEEELRKGKIRRFMTSCKIHDYDVAVLYLEQHGYDLDAATEAYVSDEEWEKAHPGGQSKTRSGNGKRKSFGLFGPR
jgi:LysM repeat protein